MAGKYLAPRTGTPGYFPKGGDSIRGKRRKIITISLAVLFFLLALGLTIYPVFSSRYNEAHQSQIHTEYQDAVQALPDTAIPEARAKAQAYNDELWSSIARYGSYSKDSVSSAVEEYAQLLDLTGTGSRTGQSGECPAGRYAIRRYFGRPKQPVQRLPSIHHA